MECDVKYRRIQGGRSVIINKNGGKSVILNNKGGRSVICRMLNVQLRTLSSHTLGRRDLRQWLS